MMHPQKSFKNKQTAGVVTIRGWRASNTVMSLLVTNAGSQFATEGRSEAASQISFTIRPVTGETLADTCRRLAHRLQEHRLTPLHLLVFGQVQAHRVTMDWLQKFLGPVNWPCTWVEGAACNGSPLAGIQVHALAGAVERIEFNGRTVASVFTDGGARQCFVGGLTPADKTLSPAEQTRQTLEDLQTVLAQAGFELADTVRTWFYLENILGWYDDFNKARTKIYSPVKFRTGSLPASTGVGAKNPDGAALALAVLAFKPLGASARAEEVASPLQCPAPAYGSAFSRAMELTSAGSQRLHISGTASIAPGGKTLWCDDVKKQVVLTMEVVEAMLRARGYTFADITRATAYFRHATDAGVFAEWLAANRLSAMPVISAQCDVCRDDLLFELEAEAEMKG